MPRPRTRSARRPRSSCTSPCLHEGTGVRAPDFLAVVDAEDGRIVHETPMPNVGDELHHFGWNRCSSACHGPDRSHLDRARLPLVAHPRPRRGRRPAPAADREGDRAARRSCAKTGLTRPHTVHCMPGDNVVISMLGDADGNGAGRLRLLDARTSTSRAAGRTAARDRRSTTTSGTSRARTCSVVASSARPTLTARLRPRGRRRRAATAAGSTSGTSASARVEQTIDLGETGLIPLEVRLLHDPDADEGFVGAALSSTMWHFHRDERRVGGRHGHRRRRRRAGGLAVPGARA